MGSVGSMLPAPPLVGADFAHRPQGHSPMLKPSGCTTTSPALSVASRSSVRAALPSGTCADPACPPSVRCCCVGLRCVRLGPFSWACAVVRAALPRDRKAFNPGGVGEPAGRQVGSQWRLRCRRDRWRRSGLGTHTTARANFHSPIPPARLRGDRAAKNMALAMRHCSWNSLPPVWCPPARWRPGWCYAGGVPPVTRRKAILPGLAPAVRHSNLFRP